jgi:hypothetical protein
MKRKLALVIKAIAISGVFAIGPGCCLFDRRIPEDPKIFEGREKVKADDRNGEGNRQEKTPLSTEGKRP